MKQSIATSLLLLFFCAGLAAQGQIGISFYKLTNLYAVEETPGREFFIPGYDNLKPRGIVSSFADISVLSDLRPLSMDVSYLYQLKSNQRLRADFTISANSHDYCFNANEGNTCQGAGADLPLNLKIGYLKFFEVSKASKIYVGSGIGMMFLINPRYTNFERKITNSGMSTASSSFNGEVLSELTTSHLKYTNRFSLYLPIYLGFERELIDKLSFFCEVQGRFNLFRPMTYIEFELESLNYPGEVNQSTVVYGNYLMGGIGVRYTLQEEDIIQ